MSATQSAPRPQLQGPAAEVAETASAGMSTRTLRAFFALAFGLTWGLGAVGVVFAEQLEPIFGEPGFTHPLFLIAMYAPALAAVALVRRHCGVRGLGSFLRRLTLVRTPAAWWAFLVVGIPAIVYIGAALSGTIGDPFPFSPWYGVLPAAAFALVLGPVEELGWRGLALPLLQRRFAPLWAGALLGAIWGLWHVPAFMFSGTPQSSWSFAPCLVGIVAVSIILTSMFNAARGSILVAALFHFQIMNPAFPDAQPWDTLVWVVAAALVVLVNRRAMLTRAGAVTEVLMPQAGRQSDGEARR